MAFLRRDDDPTVRYELSQPSTTIGRAENNDVVLEDMRVSRHHVRIDLKDEQWVIIDFQSTNGTTVNGEKIRSHSLRDGDRIHIGGATLVFVPVADPLATLEETQKQEPDRVQPEGLSDRERQVLALVGAGRTDREIAHELYISLATVRSHLDRIRDKTGCRRRPDLTRLAIELDRQ